MKFTSHINIFLSVTIAAIVAYIIIAPLVVLSRGTGQIYPSQDAVATHTVAIVFGAGLQYDGTPKDMLKDRLIAAAELYRRGKISHILVSGDNRYLNYNEPQAMFTYLTEEEGIVEDAVTQDFAGRSTVETCIRAKHIFGVDTALLISQGYHVPRAIMTCQAVGVESAGYSATRQQYLGEVKFKFRELLAIHKALLDVYILPYRYVGGEVEGNLDRI